MRVIARGTLIGYVENSVPGSHRKAVKAQLYAWFLEAQRADWKASAEVKQQYRSASIISAERVVFNIKGNDYRLVTAISYTAGIILVLWIGTHREYDQIDVSSVEFDRTRYASPSVVKQERP